MSRFIYPVNVLSQKREVRFTELTYKHYKDFNKMIVNKDNPSLARFIDDLLEELCEDYNFSVCYELTALDKFYILAFIYGTNISTNIQFSLTCPTTKKKFTHTLDLAKVLAVLDNLVIEPEIMIPFCGMECKFSLPHNLNQNGNRDELLVECFRGVYEKGIEKFGIGKVKLHQLQEFVMKLPVAVVKKATTWLNQQNAKLTTVDFLGIRSPYVQEPLIIKFVPNLFDTTLLEFAKSIYKDDLKSIYLTEYHFIRNLGFSYSDFSSFTPGEVAIYNGVEAKKEDQKPELPSKPPVAK